MFDNFKKNLQIKKAEKKIEKIEQKTENLVETNNALSGFSKREKKATDKYADEAWFADYLKRNQLDMAISTARDNLYIQRDKILRRIIRFNKEYNYTRSSDNYPNKQRDLDKYMRASKNAAYALAVVCNAIDRLDDLADEQEWFQIMRDLTNGYKTINAISTGSSIMTRLAFWIEKTKMEMKGDISVAAMEQYYGKPIDELLEDENMDGIAADFLVEDSVAEYSVGEDILRAVSRGDIFKIDPEEVTHIAQEQTVNAREKGKPQVLRGEKVYADLDDMNSDLDDLPSNM